MPEAQEDAVIPSTSCLASCSSHLPLSFWTGRAWSAHLTSPAQAGPGGSQVCRDLALPLRAPTGHVTGALPLPSEGQEHRNQHNCGQGPAGSQRHRQEQRWPQARPRRSCTQAPRPPEASRNSTAGSPHSRTSKTQPAQPWPPAVTPPQGRRARPRASRYPVPEGSLGRSLDEATIKAEQTWSRLPDAYHPGNTDTYLFTPCPQSNSKEDNSSQLSRGGAGSGGETSGEGGRKGEREREVRFKMSTMNALLR